MGNCAKVSVIEAEITDLLPFQALTLSICSQSQASLLPEKTGPVPGRKAMECFVRPSWCLFHHGRSRLDPHGEGQSFGGTGRSPSQRKTP